MYFTLGYRGLTEKSVKIWKHIGRRNNAHAPFHLGVGCFKLFNSESIIILSVFSGHFWFSISNL